MSEETKDHAFEPFFSTKEDKLGNGLGLSQVRDFVTRYGGQVTLQSAPNQGTTLTLYLPPATKPAPEIAHTPPAEAPVQAEAKAPPSTQARQTSPSVTRVMIVETERELRSMASMMLQRQGFSVQEAHDAQSAEAALQQMDGLDLLVVDATLPGDISGGDVLKSAQTKFPAIKVLFIVGPEDLPDHRAVIESLGAPCLQKPFHRQELASRLKNLL
jgi:CheY-like chemotaxis protein